MPTSSEVAESPALSALLIERSASAGDPFDAVFGVERVALRTSRATLDTESNRRWHLDGKLHREDGPAIERANGTREWYLDGELHREDGPAIEKADGTREWYLDGKLHREDGPAIERANGTREWYRNGQDVTEEEVLGAAASA